MELSQEMWDIIQLMLEVAIGVILPVVLSIVAVEGRKISIALQERIRGEIGAQNYDMVVRLAYDAVSAAEQYGLSEKIENLGTQKKEFAMAYVQKELEDAGIHIDLNRIDAAVEAAVNQTFHQE